MNRTVVAGFVAGAFVASGVSYLVSRHKAPVLVTPAMTRVAVPPPAPPSRPIEAPAPPPLVTTPKTTPAKIPARTRVVYPPPVVEQAALAPTPAPAPAVATEPDPPAPPQPVAAAPEPLQPAPGPPTEIAPEQPHTVTIANGKVVSVRLSESLSSHRNRPGDVFFATLDEPLEVDGFVIAERGARIEGRVVEAEEAGRVQGLARLVLELTRIETSDGQRVAVRTERFEKAGPASKREDAAKIGAGAVLGSIIGAAAGGGKGAAIGAAAGGAAGTGTVMATRGKPAELPVEARLTFKIDQPVVITELRK